MHAWAAVAVTALCVTGGGSAQNAAAAGGSSLHAAECSRDHIKAAISGISACKPREVVIQLPWPNNTDIQQMTPSHVLVKQCTGGCTPLQPSCLPSKTSVKRVPVLVAKCGINLGICDKECATVELEEHIDCKCACALTPRDCTEAQVFVHSECSCSCTNSKERHLCLESGKMWNSTSCSCSCFPVSCSSYQHFDYNSCSCIENEESEPTRSILNMSNAELMHLEAWIIIFLVSAVLVLFLLFICLVLKLRRIKLIQQRTKLVPSTLSGAYISSSDPCADLKDNASLLRSSSTKHRNIGVVDPARQRQDVDPARQGKAAAAELRDPCTDSSHCSHSSASSSNQSIETVPVSANLAIRSGTLSRSGPPSYKSYHLVPNAETPARHDFI